MRKIIIAGLAMLATLGAVLGLPATVSAATTASTSTSKSTLMLQLNGVSCLSRKFCAAVGAQGDRAHLARGDAPLTMIWNGAHWRKTATPLPKGWHEGQLGSVSCTSRSYCVAIGTKGAHSSPLVETWNGRAWRATKLPRPAGKFYVVEGAISCPAARRCVAVGTFVPRRSKGRAFAEILRGRKWTVRRVPLPKGSTGGFSAVSCVSVRHCVLAGEYAVKHLKVLFESWNGRTFARMRAVSPARQFPDLYGVSCTSAKHCVAVGSITRSGLYNRTGFAELWNGKRWSASRVKGPKNPLLTGVSCATAKRCMTVGSTSTNGSEQTTHALAISYNGHWTTRKVPPLAHGGTSAFSSVSCVSARDCVAVGEGGGPRGTLFSSAALTAFWNGRSWKLAGAS